MKKFIQKVIFFSVVCFIMAAGIPMLRDPYNVFHADRIRDNGIEPNKNYIKMSYILKNPEKFDAYMFGSSRVGSIHTEKIQGEHCYNMTYSAGVPPEHLANLKTFIGNGILPKKVYIGVDSLSYTEDARRHETDPIRCPYEYSKDHRADFWMLYFKPVPAVESMAITLKHEKADSFVEKFYAYGWWCEYGKKPAIDWDRAEAHVGIDDCMDEVLESVDGIVKLCASNGIETVFFTNPMYIRTYEASLEKGYLEFLERLSQITDFYNFSGRNDVAKNTDNYVDPSHYNAEVGDMILACMCNGKRYDGLYGQGFGMYVTSENIGELLAIIK